MEQARKLKSVGTYALGDVIGEGSFSIVREAFLKNRSNETYACKIIPKIKFKERNLAMRFQLEIRVMQALHHPNIVQIYDIFRDKQFYYVIMEYVKGGTLFDYICNNRRIHENDAKDFMYQIFNAIKYIHSLGICHRDLKLENILLDENYSVIKISDFGLSKFLSSDGLTKTPVGSPLYASPECLSGQPYDARKSDIWSCGVIMYAVLSGKMPWFGKTQAHIFSQIKKANYEMPSYLSPDSKQLIRAILTNDVNKRPSATEVLKSKWLTSQRERLESNLLNRPNKLLSLKSLDSFFQKDIKSRISSASFELLLSVIHDNEKNLLPELYRDLNNDEKDKKNDKTTTKSVKNEKEEQESIIKKVPSTTAFDIDFDKKLHSILFEKVESPVPLKHRSSLPPKIKKKNKKHRGNLIKKEGKAAENQDDNINNNQDDNTNNSNPSQDAIKPRNRCNSQNFLSFKNLPSSHTSTSDNFVDYSSKECDSNTNNKVEINPCDAEIKNVPNSDDLEILYEKKIENSNTDENEPKGNKKHSKYKNKKDKKDKKDKKVKKDKKDKKEKKSKKEKKAKQANQISEILKVSDKAE